MTAILSLLFLGCYSSVLSARARHKSLLELHAQQDFEWRTLYYRRCGHWRWQKDWQDTTTLPPPIA